MTSEQSALKLVTARRKAIVYLRVSTPRQMETATDIDADGNSIATQREQCGRKAEAVDATIVREFVEPGNSAQTIEKRPVFLQLLQYVADNPDIDYVIIYMRSRAFRNLGDAVITKRRLEQYGIRLLSAKEDFGEGYLADAMEAVTDIFNEIEVRRNGEDIRQKLEHKARSGGTIGRAKLGYLNIRIDIDGRLVNSIGIDEVPAPLVRQAFELYATGEYSIESLCEVMSDRGLKSRASRTFPSKIVGVESMRKMLRDPYYTGAMVYKGQIITEGRHQAIIDQDLWDRVQTVLDLRSRRGQRDRVLKHYLKGLLYCGRCKQAGRISRLVYTEARGRNGEYYGYFLCMGRQQGFCSLPHLPAAQVEDAVAFHYADLALGPDFINAVEDQLAEVLAERQQLTQRMHESLKRELAVLDSREDRLIELAAEGTLSKSKIQQRINTLRVERRRIQSALDDTGEELKVGAQRLLECIQLISNPAAMYAKASDTLRRHLNQTLFEHVYIDEDETITVGESSLQAPFEEIVASGRAYALLANGGHEKSPILADGALDVLDLFAYPVIVSSKTKMVELRVPGLT